MHGNPPPLFPGGAAPPPISGQIHCLAGVSFVYSYLQVVDDILDCTSTSEVLGKTAGKDLATDKTTYPSLLGLERSKEVADELINAAHDALASYDPLKAAPLRALAEFVRSRKN